MQGHNVSNSLNKKGENEMKRKIGCFMLALLMTCSSLLGVPSQYVAATGSVQSMETKMEQAVANYMEYRYGVLTTGETEIGSEITVVGIVNDEVKHTEVLNTKGIEIVDYDFEITDTEGSDEMSTVNVKESFRYMQNGVLSTDETEHVLTVMKNNSGKFIVASDEYFESASEFASCSYVSPEDAVVKERAVQVVPLIITIAKSQVGYKEKASNSNLSSFTANAGSNNYTKYGAWYGNNGQPWCATFVSWCANQAGISTSMVPKYESCDAGMSKFKSWGRFYYSKTYGGSYTPKVGDIFFTGSSTSDSTHTGIVVGVSGSTITVVDGNYGDQVSSRTMSINNSSLIGFGNPVYASCSHSIGYGSNTSNHWQKCLSTCGVKFSYSSAHTFSSGKCTVCGRIQAVTASN